MEAIKCDLCEKFEEGRGKKRQLDYFGEYIICGDCNRALKVFVSERKKQPEVRSKAQL